MSVRSKTFLVGKKTPTFFLKKFTTLYKKKIFILFHHSVPTSTNEFARSDWSSFFIFLFLILLVPLIYRFGSSFNGILPSSHTTSVLANFSANFKILLRKPRPCWTAIVGDVYLAALLFVCKVV